LTAVAVRPLERGLRERKRRSAPVEITNQSSPSMDTSKKSTYMIDAEAELSVLVAALSEEARVKVFTFFKKKMASSYRNGFNACKAGRELRQRFDAKATVERA
jgi:hypothetical protein